jgi:hypothetical protein
MRIRLRLAIGAALLATILSSACIHSAEQARRRDEGYQAQLAWFSQVLKPGMTRKEVESYLHANGRELIQMCCMGRWKNAYDDLTKIGQEPHPWYCSAHSVYVGFEFVSSGSHEFPEAHDSDTLNRVQIYHWFEGCL